MDTFYLIAHVTQEGCEPERASVECQDLYESGLPVAEYLTLCGCFQNEWFLDDVRVGRSPEGQIVRYWGEIDALTDA